MGMHLDSSLKNGDYLNEFRSARRSGGMASGKGKCRRDYALSQEQRQAQSAQGWLSIEVRNVQR